MSASTKHRAVRAAESFIITFLAVFVTATAGLGKAPDWNAEKAALVAVIPAAITAAVRAAWAGWRA